MCLYDGNLDVEIKDQSIKNIPCHARKNQIDEDGRDFMIKKHDGNIEAARTECQKNCPDFKHCDWR